MSETNSEPIDLERRLAYLQMDDADRERLATFAPALKADAKQFVETFYRHLFAFPETARFLQQPAVVERLKQMQEDHLASMLDAKWDEQFASRRRRVGDVHAQMGVTPQIFIGAYYQYLQYGLRKLAAEPQADVPAYAENILSLLKAVFLDVELTLEAYFLQATQNQRHALDMLFQANTALRQFAQLTSHDLKTPLGTLANLCDEALDEFGNQMPAEASRLIERARDRAFRMSSTIDEVLTATINVGDQSTQVVESAAVIDAAVEYVRPVLDKKTIQLKVAGGLPRVLGDPALLREAFYNLLSNAAKFIQREHGRIVIDVEVRKEECQFSIADNGPGIPSEELSRIFVPFRRLRMQQDVPGTGLGLYFTKNIIEQQGGRIWAESELGEGSCFYVLLKMPPRSTKF